MDLTYARRMGDLTTTFYQRVGSSFSVTRQSPWPGWRELLDLVRPCLGESPTVLDLACGNLRFERFLADEGIAARVWAIDNNDELMGLGEPDELAVQMRHLDVLAVLCDGRDLGHELEALGVPACDLAVCFGFMHHVPLAEQRVEVLRTLVDAVRPGGLVAVSLWQFARDARLMAKARPVEGGVPGDYLLGWQHETDVWRFCHSFAEAEVDALVDACAPQAAETARFSADGRRGDLNRYIVLQRC